MGILLGRQTRVLVQGLTGREGSFHAQQMIAYGTKVVAGVTPGKGGGTHLEVPIFDTVAGAVAATGAEASCIFVPAAFAGDAICEAAEAGVPLIVCITEGIPTADMIRACAYVKARGARLVGPNCPGLLTVGEAKMGIIPPQIAKPGVVGMVSRSGTLTYEAADLLSRAGLGLTTIVGIGGDPVLGTRFADVLPLFEADPATRAIVLIGEIGGTDEEAAAALVPQLSKPVVGFVGGRSAPEGKRMGHAGAIVSGNLGTAASKVAALEAVGVAVPLTLAEIPGCVAKALG
ncbi:MAG: succinate--CoA ligase subunit alpha [Fimbriimonadaceae bacterium]|nr:succinate--CoA ligase subunit alpha [Fimbriimonadaceae bacterium]